MAIGLLDKLTNFLMPIEDSLQERRPNLHVHSQYSVANIKIFVATPTTFDDVQMYAEYLRNEVIILVNFQKLDLTNQQRMVDFLNGVCFILGGTTSKISNKVFIYAPDGVNVASEFLVDIIPTYI